jgi:predicted HicB family RNase H-like nuclease
MKNESFTLRLNPDLIKRIRILALEKGGNANELINQALTQYLEKHRITEKKTKKPAD